MEEAAIRQLGQYSKEELCLAIESCPAQAMPEESKPSAKPPTAWENLGRLTTSSRPERGRSYALCPLTTLRIAWRFSADQPLRRRAATTLAPAPPRTDQISSVVGSGTPASSAEKMNN